MKPKKIEKYRDGRVLYAYNDIEKGTFLSPEPMCDINIYNSVDEDETLKGIEIDKKSFFIEWDKLLF